MADAQILMIAMSTAPTMLLVLVGILINNARLLAHGRALRGNEGPAAFGASPRRRGHRRPLEAHSRALSRRAVNGEFTGMRLSAAGRVLPPMLLYPAAAPR